MFRETWSDIGAMGIASAERHHIFVSALLWLQDDGAGVLRRVWGYVNHEYKIGNFNISVVHLVTGIAVLLLAIFISRSLRNILERRMVGSAHLDPGIQYTILRLIHYVIITVGVLYALRTALGVDLTTLAVVFTALSVGIGFGLQFIAGDIASGFILLFERPVRVGDYIKVSETANTLVEGKVQSINLRTTVVMTNDRIAVIVPNSKLVNQSLVNWSYGDPRARISVPVGVANDSDVDLVTKTLLSAAEGVKNVLESPKPIVQFLRFGDSSLDFRLLVWTDRPRRHPQITSDLNYRIRRLFNEAGISTPIPGSVRNFV